MSRKRLILEGVLAVFGLALYLMLFHVHFLVYRVRHYKCAVCGVCASTATRCFAGVQYGSSEDFPSPAETTKEYRELVGAPHDHEWVYRAWSVSRETILGGGRTQHADRFPWRLRLMQDALQVIKNDFKDSPREFRQNLYSRLINSDWPDEFSSVLDQAGSEAAAKPGQAPEGEAELQGSEKADQPALGTRVR